MKTPAEIARAMGCTEQQARAQLARNAAQLDAMAAKAKATGKKVNGYTYEQLAAKARDCIAAAAA